jgi:hypothetical protein
LSTAIHHHPAKRVIGTSGERAANIVGELYALSAPLVLTDLRITQMLKSPRR